IFGEQLALAVFKSGHCISMEIKSAGVAKSARCGRGRILFGQCQRPFLAAASEQRAAEREHKQQGGDAHGGSVRVINWAASGRGAIIAVSPRPRHVSVQIWPCGLSAGAGYTRDGMVLEKGYGKTLERVGRRCDWRDRCDWPRLGGCAERTAGAVESESAGVDTRCAGSAQWRGAGGDALVAESVPRCRQSFHRCGRGRRADRAGWRNTSTRMARPPWPGRWLGGGPRAALSAAQRRRSRQFYRKLARR